ncbi:MAG: hypothetical protein ABR564_04370 [Candidatus Dormibacteria bacterium]
MTRSPGLEAAGRQAAVELSGLRPLRLLGVAALFVGLVTAGCGDTTTARPTPVPSPTPVPGSHADFVTRADRECRASHATLDQRPAPRSVPDVVAYLKTTIDANAELERKLRGLTPPAADAAVVSALLDDFHALITKTMEVRQLTLSGDAAGADKAVSELQDQATKAAARSRQFGFSACGIPATPPSSPAV